MPSLSFAPLSLAVAGPAVAALLLMPLWRVGSSWLRTVPTLVGLLSALWATLVAFARLLDVGAWRYRDVGGWVGARVTADLGATIGADVPLALLPQMAPLAVAVALVGLVAGLLLVLDRSRTALPPSSLAAVLLLVACAEGMLLCERLPHIATAFILSSFVATWLPVAGHGSRDEVFGSTRAFIVQRLGDALLVMALIGVGLGFSAVDLTAVLTEAPELGPWQRFEAGPLTGLAHRQLWFGIGILVVAAAATRTGLFPVWPLLSETTGGRVLVGVAHGLGFQLAGLVLLVRLRPLLALAPEAQDALVVAGALTACLAPAVALLGRDLARIDVHLWVAVSGFAAVCVGLGDLSTTTLALLLLVVAALPMGHAHAHVIGESHQRDPFQLGGLERRMPRTHTARLLGTLALSALPPFAGFAVVARACELALGASRIPFIVVPLLLLGAFLLSAAGYRAVHLVFTGAERGPALAACKDPPTSHALVPLLPAFLAPGLVLLSLPVVLVLLWVPGLRYDAPLAMLAAPSGAAAAAVEALYAATPQLLPPGIDADQDGVSDVVEWVLALAAAAAGVLGYCVSAVLWRKGPGRVHARLSSLPWVARLTRALAARTEQESAVARGVGEGATRLSRLLAANLLPGILDLVLRRLPAAAAWSVSLLLRALHNGSAQRAILLVTIVGTLLTFVVLRGGAS